MEKQRILVCVLAVLKLTRLCISKPTLFLPCIVLDGSPLNVFGVMVVEDEKTLPKANFLDLNFALLDGSGGGSDLCCAISILHWAGIYMRRCLYWHFARCTRDNYLFVLPKSMVAVIPTQIHRKLSGPC